MKNRTAMIALALTMCLLALTGCSGKTAQQPDNTPTASPSASLPAESPLSSQTPPPAETVLPTPQPEETPSPRPEEPVAVADREELKAQLLQAIEELRQPWIMDISALALETPELDVKNMYYEITRDFPHLKYAYDLTGTCSGDTLTCTVSYMPYITGDFPEGFEGEEVSSIQTLLAVAGGHLGEESAPIRITEKTLEPDKMNRALQQIGGGYILCALSKDGTQLQYSPAMGMTMANCMDGLAEADRLADEVIAQVVTDGMTQREQAQAVYAYLTVNVVYDQRYYSDFSSMPYESQTALGALRDNMAICGGYANALDLMFEKLGIPCYTISGKYFRENHMWNLAQLDGEWLWFDATSDRGNSGEYGFLRFALSGLDGTKYQYEESDVQQLMG